MPYLQQVAMESNGKSISRNSEPLNYDSAPIIWGGVGTNTQHSFFQWLHQGTNIAPCDFIAIANDDQNDLATHKRLLANCFAQSRALMVGKSNTACKKENIDTKIITHRTFAGNRPSNTLLLNNLEPHTLGALAALYEHKTFAEGMLWNIYSFDQWGVELGKQTAQDTLRALKDEPIQHLDTSTQGLIHIIKHGITT